jgi:hypothetical protein
MKAVSFALYIYIYVCPSVATTAPLDRFSEFWHRVLLLIILNNIKMDLREVGWGGGHGMDKYGSG